MLFQQFVNSQNISKHDSHTTFFRIAARLLTCDSTQHSVISLYVMYTRISRYHLVFQLHAHPDGSFYYEFIQTSHSNGKNLNELMISIGRETDWWNEMFSISIDLFYNNETIQMEILRKSGKFSIVKINGLRSVIGKFIFGTTENSLLLWALFHLIVLVSLLCWWSVLLT